MGSNKINVLMIGTGEYTTGYVHDSASDSDKKAGVVALCMMDLRRRGYINKLGLVGTNGKKFPGIRKHMEKMIANKYKDMDIQLETYPSDDTVDSNSYLEALDQFHPGDAVTIFTPDDTHYKIALAAIQRGIHVLVTKPVTKNLQDHLNLYKEAKKHNVLVAVEVHKRFDPIYIDARDRIQNLGDFSYISSFMSQPKHQLETFKSWAGKSSDISYYLNSHHIDFHEWCMSGQSRPIRVTGTSSTGVAYSMTPSIKTEDTISITTQWENKNGSTGTATYTATWIAAKSDVHSQQRFFYMGHEGEVNVDQAHRGYTISTHKGGYQSVNPLFMKYTPSNGYFSGQSGYGYKSFEEFIKCVQLINDGQAKPEDFDNQLATLGTTFLTTAILEAGRMSLDLNGQPIEILYDSKENNIPIGLQPLNYSN